MKLERERLQQEKAERHRMWNMDESVQQSSNRVRELSDLKYDMNSQEDSPPDSHFPHSEYSQPLHVETDRQVYAVSGAPNQLRKTAPVQSLAKSEPVHNQYGTHPREHSPPEKLEPNYGLKADKSIGMAKSKSENWMDVYREQVPSHHQRYASDTGLAAKPAPAIAKKPLLLKKEPVSAQYTGPSSNYENVYRGDFSDVHLRNRKNVQQDDELRRHSYAPEASSVATARDEAMRVSRRPKSSHDDSSPVSNKTSFPRKT